ncbi:hypothetical protein [Streptomyces atroolivaceus]|uniref:hypothetical protein n=1 Tax=Streptomyces atroolivaceus TaxID=66869 RepID=UPI0036B99C4E
MTTTPRTWASGETPTGAIFNTEIRDQFNSVFDAWTPYTPTWTASTNPNIGAGVITGRYIKIGRTCHVAIRQSHAGNTTYGAGGYTWSLPFPSAAGVDYLGVARLVGAAAWNGQTVSTGGSSGFNATFPTSATDSRSATLAATVPETLTAASVIRLFLTYQTAS